MYHLAILNVPRRLRVACRGHNVERRGYLSLGLGDCAPPPPPRPLSLDRQRKGGKKARPWRTSQGLLPATRYALLTHLPAHGRSGSRTRRPSPKSPAARRLPPGAKKRCAGLPAVDMFCRAGESSRCEDPAPTVGIARRSLRGMPHRPSCTPT